MRPTSKTEAPRQSAEERREAVIEAAVAEFAAYGLHGASTEAIAERVGISQPYIFRLFGTKKELFHAAVERVVGRIVGELRTSIAAQPEHPLEAMGQTYKRLLTQRDELVLLLHAFAAAHDPEVRAFARAHITRICEFLQDVTGASDDEVRHILAHGMLLMVTASMDLSDAADDNRWAATLTKVDPTFLIHHLGSLGHAGRSPRET